ncbi:MAG: hypothetical protein ACM3YE_05660 [Bacteroidota bacterium]
MVKFFKMLAQRIDKLGSGEAGMTLLEVLLTLALTGISAGVLVAVFMQTVHTREQLNGRVTAQILGACKLAELGGRGELGNSGVFSEPYRKFRWTAQEEELEGGASVIYLTVEWSRGNDLLQKTFRGYREPEYDDLD